MGAVLLPIIGFILNLTLIILFYSKKHILNNETRSYSKLLILNILFIIIGLITFVIAKVTNNHLWIRIFQKIYMSIMIVIDYLSINYCFYISNIEIKKNKLLKLLLLLFTFGTIALIIITPLKVIYYDDILDGEGFSYNVAVIYSVLSYFVFLGVTFYLIYKKEKITKLIPFLTLIFLYLIGFILRNMYRELIFEGFFYSYIFLIMYHTIENPDLKMVRQLQLAKNQMEKSNKIKSEFLSSMSHEIRTPLNAIVGYSQLIEYANTLEEAKENAKDIVESSNMLLNMYSNLLNVYKIEANDIEITKVEYNPKDEFNSILDMFDYRFKEKQIKLVRKIEKTPKLNGELDIIKKVVINVLDNAIKYTDKGQITFKATLEDDNQLVITIEDTGQGIKKENMNKLFTNFERLDYKDSNVNGMGLGLSLSKNLLESIDGKIIVDSEYKKGTKVTITVKAEVVK